MCSSLETQVFLPKESEVFSRTSWVLLVAMLWGQSPPWQLFDASSSGPCWKVGSSQVPENIINISKTLISTFINASARASTILGNKTSQSLLIVILLQMELIVPPLVTAGWDFPWQANAVTNRISQLCKTRRHWVVELGSSPISFKLLIAIY